MAATPFHSGPGPGGVRRRRRRRRRRQVCASAFVGEEAEAFALYRTVQAATNFVLFLATPLLSLDGGHVAGRHGLAIELLLLLGTTVAGLLSWAAFERRQPAQRAPKTRL